MTKRKKKKVDKEIEEWNKKVRELGEKNRQKLVNAINKGKNA
jgi:hypothetical protein|tara:strand:- start:7835 stop:7960 length:126 start_codon:yes stop_codon:yes gene_type:complete